MTEPERPPVEALSDVAWSRVERGVWSELDAETIPATPRASRRWWLALPAIAAAAVVAIVVFARSSDHPTAQAPTRVTSGASPSSVALGDAHIALDPQSSIVMEPSNVLVERGAAWFSVEPRGARPPFIVTAGDARVRVVGTRFLVARSDERIAVTVDHGIVEIGYHGELVRVTNGQHWTSEAPHDVVDGPIATAQPVVPPPVVAPEPPPVVAPPPVTNHSRDDRDGQRYAALARLEASDPESAMRGYLVLSKGSSRWAEIALYAAARLASDRHDPRAKSFLQIYLRRYPNGANAVDARQLLGGTR